MINESIYYLKDMYFNHRHRLFTELCEIKDLETFEFEDVVSKDDILRFAKENKLEVTEIDEHTYVITDSKEKLEKIINVIKERGIPVMIVEIEDNKFMFFYYDESIDDMTSFIV